MDTQKLLKEAKARFKHHENKLYLQEKYKNRLQFASQNGMWTASTNLITFLVNAPETVILVDDFGNPTKVYTQQLREDAWKIYDTTMREWFEEYTALSDLR